MNPKPKSETVNTWLVAHHLTLDPSPHGYEEAEQAAAYIRSRGFAPRVAITLGSGLDEVVGRLHAQVKIPYKLIPHFPGTTVQGHGGTLHLGTGKVFPWPFWKVACTITKAMRLPPWCFPCAPWHWRG
jgi:hypothetical protein